MAWHFCKLLPLSHPPPPTPISRHFSSSSLPFFAASVRIHIWYCLWTAINHVSSASSQKGEASARSRLPAPYQEKPFKEHRVGAPAGPGRCRKWMGKDMKRQEREGNGGSVLGWSSLKHQLCLISPLTLVLSPRVLRRFCILWSVPTAVNENLFRCKVVFVLCFIAAGVQEGTNQSSWVMVVAIFTVESACLSHCFWPGLHCCPSPPTLRGSVVLQQLCTPLVLISFNHRQKRHRLLLSPTRPNKT